MISLKCLSLVPKDGYAYGLRIPLKSSVLNRSYRLGYKHFGIQEDEINDAEEDRGATSQKRGRTVGDPRGNTLKEDKEVKSIIAFC
jgi:hypothetical protein